MTITEEAVKKLWDRVEALEDIRVRQMANVILSLLLEEDK